MLGFGSGWKKGYWAGLLAVACANLAFAAQSLRLAVVDGRSGAVHDATVLITQEDGQVFKTVADQGALLVKEVSGSSITISVTSPTHGTAETKTLLPDDPDMGILLHLHGNTLRAEFVPGSNLPTGGNANIGDSVLSDVQRKVVQTRTGVTIIPMPPPAIQGAGDECVSAMPLTCGDTDSVIVLGGGFLGNTNGATPGDPVSSCEVAVGGPFSHDASWWYDLVIPADSTVMVSMCAGDVLQDAVMGLVDNCANLTEIACDDDFCAFPTFSAPSLNNNIPILLTAGNYKLVIQAYSGGYDPAIPFEISVVCVPVGPPPYGACCNDLTSVCEDCVQGNCPPPLRFTANTTCADLDPPCGEVMGACCDTVVGGCTDATPAQCLATNGQYSGNFTTCLTFVCPCVTNCPPGSLAENEPDCAPDYADVTNGGCNSPVNNPGASSCCNPQAGPGCDDAGCQAAVCAVDPFCCATQWDGICADEAVTICAPLCDGAVTFPYFSLINSGETVCGGGGTYTTGLGDTRDTDWYKITLASYTQITWTVEAEFPLLMGIVDTGGVDDCTQVSAFLTSATAGECEPAMVEGCLAPGTWYLFVAPSVFTGIPCDRDYTATYTTAACPTGACCPGDGSCVDGQTLPQCDALLGSFAGANTTCAAGACPANETCTTADPGSVPGFVSGDTTLAGNDVTPTCGTSSATKGLWYSVVGNGQQMTISTCNAQTDFDTKVHVYCNCSATPYLMCVGGNDDGGTVDCELPSGDPYKSRFSWCSEVNHTYYIKVGGFGIADFGTFQLDISGGAACSPFFNCVPPTGACCVAGTCAGTTTNEACGGMGGQWFTGQTCPAFSCPIPATNETCQLAINIPAVPYVAAIDNNLSLAGGLPGDCNSGGAVTTQNDIWWSYTPAANCGLVLNLNPTTYDGIVNMYTGPNCNSLAAIPFAPTCNNDEPEPIVVNINAIGGTTYWFQVGDWGVSEGGGMTNFNLNCSNATGACCTPSGSCSVTTQGGCVGSYQGDFTTCTPNNCPQPPPNDACLAPAPLGALPASVTVSNSLATDDPESTATCTTGSVNQAVWYTVVGNGSTYSATLCNAGGTFNDTKIQVWCNTCALPVCVAGNDDAACGISGLRSTVSWCTSVGTTYRIAIGGFGANAGTMQLTVTSGAACGGAISCAPAYCASAATSTADEDITRVQFNTIDNNSAATPCSLYTNYTAINTTVQQGSIYALTVTKGDCEGAGCFTSFLKAWVDWNQDLDFTDAGEEVMATSVANAPCPTLVVPSVNVTVPGGAMLGATRMRLAMKEGGTAANTTPCGAITWGETEDYTVIIAPPSPPLGGPPFDDDDGDGVPNFCDNCPDDANANQADADGDNVGDPCDECPGFDDNADSDGDGVANGCDVCPGFDDNVDTDGDGTANGCDGCPNDPAKIAPGICGCGNSDVDSDGDGTADCQDLCPNDPNKVVPGICGCGVAETGDSDGDGVSDCVDQCPGVDDAVFFPGCQGAIPTMSHWGLVVLALLLLVLSKVYYGRRTATA